MKQLPDHRQRVDLINQVVENLHGSEDTTHNRVIAWDTKPGKRGIVHTFVGGSDLHGATLGENNDLDIFGVFIETPEFALGIHGGNGLPPWETFQWSTSGNHKKNTSTDVDVTCHSLRKWARLASQGNPTVLDYLYTPLSEPGGAWEQIVAHRHLFLARNHVKAFLGYAEAQFQRLNGLRAQNTNRPELTNKYGFDTKMAMHMIRLMIECNEFLKTGHITFPCPQKDMLIAIRQGKWKLSSVNDLYRAYEKQCTDWVNASTLPEDVDKVGISRLLADVYETHWKNFNWHPMR